MSGPGIFRLVDYVLYMYDSYDNCNNNENIVINCRYAKVKNVILVCDFIEVFATEYDAP